jgi:hypothetical protein
MRSNQFSVASFFVFGIHKWRCTSAGTFPPRADRTSFVFFIHLLTDVSRFSYAVTDASPQIFIQFDLLNPRSFITINNPFRILPSENNYQAWHFEVQSITV